MTVIFKNIMILNIEIPRYHILFGKVSYIYIQFIRESLFMDNLMLFKVLLECERLLARGSSCLNQ